MSSDFCWSYPVEQSIGGIKIIIIDPHNEIVPYWFGEFLRHKCNLIVVRIDAHHDMFHYCPALPAREGRDMFQFLSGLMPYLQDYCREKVNEGNFTCPGFHYGAIGAVYHFHPKENQIDAYGRVSGSETIDAPRTVEKYAHFGGGKCRWIVWDENSTRLRGSSAKAIPVPRKMTLNDFHRDLQDCLLPIAVGFDLDGLYGNGDRGSPDEVIKKRLAGVGKVLESVARPEFICLARSQTPRSYVPAKIVDKVQESALGLIEEKYV
ncbi:MAG: hypothetical protein QG575_1536 [Euryarchaeota archaeon]|nr:hypothetical protein [Euryarchaeota archaeon]